MKVKGSKI